MKLKEIIEEKCQYGSVTRRHGLGMVPILCESGGSLPAIDLLDEAIGGQTVRIVETSETGEVPYLLLLNHGRHPVLVLDGEELVGGKQNRVVNSSILVLPGTELKVPVSCMEAGRWLSQNEQFESGGALFRARSRAVHKAGVTSNLRARGSFQSDQDAIWDQVSLSLYELGVESATSDFRAGREKVAHRIEEFVAGLNVQDGQIGAVFLSTSGILGCELLGSPELFSRSFPKIVRSFAFEVLSEPDLQDGQHDGVDKWWKEVLAAGISLHRSPGAGEDVRLATGTLIGSGLLWDQRLVHFSCFPSDGADQQLQPANTRRVAASERRNRMKSKMGA